MHGFLRGIPLAENDKASATRRNSKGAPTDRGALVGLALASLEQELQSELDLTRIRAGEARGPNLAEVP